MPKSEDTPWRAFQATLVGRLRLPQAAAYGSSIHQICIDDHANLWLLLDATLIRYDGANIYPMYEWTEPVFPTSLQLFQGILYIGTTRGVYRVVHDEMTVVSTLPQGCIIDMQYAGEPPQLWVAYDMGSLWSTRDGNIWTQTLLPSWDYVLHTFHISRTSGLWVAGKKQSGQPTTVFQQRMEVWEQYPPLKERLRPIHRYQSRALYFDTQHRLWLGTGEHGLWWYENNAWHRERHQATAHRPGIYAQFIDDMFEDGSHNLWAITGSHLTQYYNTQWYPVYAAVHAISNTRIYHILRDEMIRSAASCSKTNRLWFGGAFGVFGWLDLSQALATQGWQLSHDVDAAPQIIHG